MNNKKTIFASLGLIAFVFGTLLALGDPFVLDPGTGVSGATQTPVMISSSNSSIVNPVGGVFGGDMSISNLWILGNARTRSIINTGAVFIVESPNAIFDDNVLIGGKTNHVELVISHEALNTNNVFSIYRGGVLKDYQQANGYQLHTGQYEVTGASTFRGALTIGGAISVYDTNAAPASTNPVAWLTLTTTNGASFRIPLMQ